jgi:methanogenic corrinoid protein MtbC1
VSDRPSAIETTERLQTALGAHDREGAVRAILAAVEGGIGIEELYSQVLSPVLVSVGRAWQEGRACVWEEHLIVGAIRAGIESLYPKILERKAGIEPLSLTVAFFCPPEETHDVGLRMLADRFDLRGFRTIYIGAGTPVAEMVRCVQSESVDVVCLSASTHFQKTALYRVIESLRASLPGVRIVAGGPAFAHPGAGWEAYAVGSVDDLLDELAAQARAAHGAKAAPGPSAASPAESRSDA